MSRPIFIPTGGTLVPNDVAAWSRYALMKILSDAKREQVRIPDSVVETFHMIDIAGAAWENRLRSLPNVSPDVSSIAPQSFDPVQWIPVKNAAEQLDVTPQAVTGLLSRGSLHGEKRGRTWRVCVASVAARREGTTCQH
jgi:hypothetical protein